MSTVVVPLWALEIGTAPFLIGIALGARAALSIPFSIHGGALMDRLGPRRIMIASGAGVALLTPLYPILPWIEALIVLQLAVGFFQGFAWMGAQTQISLMTRSDPSVIGRFTFVATLGNFIGPLATGIAWDRLGPAGAFALIAIAGVGIVIAGLLLPRDRGAAAEGDTAVRPRDLLPRLRDYTEAFRMTMIPAVGFVVVASFLMTSIYGARHSFYTVYLEGIGFSGTLIGVLFAGGSLAASSAGLLTGPARRLFPANWVLLIVITIAALGIAVTPLFTEFGSLFALALFWGVGGGLAFPLTLYVLSRTVGPEHQGMSIGIRTTVNRTAGFLTPVIMGALAQAAGLMTSLFVVGGVLLVCLGLMALWLMRAPHLRVRD